MATSECHYIAIEGVIGVGKTTLALLLGQKLGAQLLLEEVEENPFLPDFYRDQRRYAFQTQIFFLLSRYRQQRALLQRDLFVDLLISDYIFQKDRIFANINLDDKELLLYEQLIPLMERDVPSPDRIVYLQASVDVLLDRIRKRARQYEREMDPAYLEALAEAYNYFFFHCTGAPVLIVNTNDLDFVGNPDHLDDLARRILDHTSGTAYYTPTGGSEE